MATGLSPVISMAVMSVHWKKPEKNLRITHVRLSQEVIRTDVMLGLKGNTGVAAGCRCF